jgi:hypothetical protein
MEARAGALLISGLAAAPNRARARAPRRCLATAFRGTKRGSGEGSLYLYYVDPLPRPHVRRVRFCRRALVRRPRRDGAVQRNNPRDIVTAGTRGAQYPRGIATPRWPSFPQCHETRYGAGEEASLRLIPCPLSLSLFSRSSSSRRDDEPGVARLRARELTEGILATRDGDRALSRTLEHSALALPESSSKPRSQR